MILFLTAFLWFAGLYIWAIHDNDAELKVGRGLTITGAFESHSHAHSHSRVCLSVHWLGAWVRSLLLSGTQVFVSVCSSHSLFFSLPSLALFCFPLAGIIIAGGAMLTVLGWCCMRCRDEMPEETKKGEEIEMA